MSTKNVISIGDEVLVPRIGRQTVTAIEYSPEGPHKEPQNLTAIHFTDAFSKRVVFVFESGRWAEGSQVVSMPLAREIVPDLRST
jgi:hypothetical protein